VAGIRREYAPADPADRISYDPGDHNRFDVAGPSQNHGTAPNAALAFFLIYARAMMAA
jgi:hypothetical protein